MLVQGVGGNCGVRRIGTIRRRLTAYRPADRGRRWCRCGAGRRPGAGPAVPRLARADVSQRRVRRGCGDHHQRAVPRGLPDQPTDRVAVHRPAAGAEGARAGAAVRVQELGEAARTGSRAAELVGQPAAPAVAGPHAGDPDAELLPGPDRLQDRPADPDARLHHLAGAADRRDRPAHGLVRRGGKPRGRRQPVAAAEHDLRVQRHLPRPDDQRRVRQAGDRPVREPPRREPARTWTGRTSAPRTCPS